MTQALQPGVKKHGSMWSAQQVCLRQTSTVGHKTQQKPQSTILLFVFFFVPSDYVRRLVNE